MTNHMRKLGITCLALITLGFLGVSVSKAAIEDNAAIVSKLLSEAKTQAFQLKEDAGELQLLTLVPPSAASATQISSQTQAEAIHRINQDVNAMAAQLTKLENMQKSAAPWQKIAIDQIKPLVTELISSTQELIQIINNHPKRLDATGYKDYVEANSDKANELSALIAAFVDYGKAKERQQRLGDKLGLPY